MKIKTPTTIRCRGNKIKTYKIDSSKSITVAYFGDSILYLSDCEPIAIDYKSNTKPSIMTFRRCGSNSVKDKIELRKFIKFDTVMPSDFDDALSVLIAGL